MSLYSQYEKAFSNIARPFAFLDLNHLDENILFVKEHLGDKHIRIATKSIRSIEVLNYIAQSFPTSSGWMTFSAKEILFLAKKGFDYFLMGYPILEREDVEQLIPFIREGK